MQNFVYHNPTKVIFGKGCISQIGTEAKNFGNKALFVYDENAAKKSGVYDQIVRSLKEAGIAFVEFTQIRENPVIADARKGIELARKEKIEFIVAAGGGSAIDEAKAIAAGLCVAHDVWDFFCGKAVMKTAMPVLAVITKSATGTETNGGSVMMNEETSEKVGLILPPLFPKIAFMDPSVTRSLPNIQLAYGAVDAISHLLEGYLTNDDPETPTVDEYAEGLIRSIVSSTEQLLENPDHDNARATFMWSAALAWNGLVLAGIGKCGYPNHLIGHAMSALYGTQHGASISVSFSGWMPYFIAESAANARKMSQFGKAVFAINGQDTTKSAEATVAAFRNWCKKIGAPTTLKEIGIDDTGLHRVAENASLGAEGWGIPQYTKERISHILSRCE